MRVPIDGADSDAYGQNRKSCLGMCLAEKCRKTQNRHSPYPSDMTPEPKIYF